MKKRTWLNINKEYESEIGKYRILRGFRIRDLAEASGVSYGQIAALQNGTTAPCYLVGKKAGKIKPWVKLVCQKLRADADDLFPRYFCKMERDRHEGIVYEQMFGIIVGGYADKSPFDFVEQKCLIGLIKKVFSSFDPRTEKILILRFFNEWTFEEIGNKFNVNKERIRQIEAKALRKIRHLQISKKLKDFYFSD